MTDQRSGARSYFAHADCGATWSLDGDVAEALCPNCDVLVVRRPRRPDAPAARSSGRVTLDIVRILVDAGATHASAVRAATVLERGGSYDAASAELVPAQDAGPAPLLISDFEWLSLAHAIETGGDHPLDELIENRPVVIL